MFKNGGSVPETVKHFVLGWTALGGDHGDFERKAWQTLLPGNEPNTEEMKKVRVGGLCPPTHTFSFAPLCLAHSQAAASATPFSQNLRDRHPRPSTQGPCLTVSGTEPPLLNKVVTRTKCPGAAQWVVRRFCRKMVKHLVPKRASRVTVLTGPWAVGGLIFGFPSPFRDQVFDHFWAKSANLPLSGAKHPSGNHRNRHISFW